MDDPLLAAAEIRGRHRSRGKLLELDRGLPLVRHAKAQAEQRRNSVEKPTHARRQRSVEAQRLADNLPVLERNRPAGQLEVRGSDPPGLADRGLAPGERHGREVSDPLERPQVATEELTAPQRAVRAVAGSVEDERENRVSTTVLGKARSGVGVMVLDADELHIAVLLLGHSPFRREIFRVEVVRDHLRRHVEHGEIQVEIGLEGVVRDLGVEVAEVGGEERLRATRDAERALELGAGRNQRARRRQGQRYGPGSEAAGAADRERDRDDGVLAAAVDRPVVPEERVGDRAEPLPRLVVRDRDRLIRSVATRHHERPAEVRDEKVMEWGVGEHHAELGHARSDRLGDRRIRAS